MLWLILYFLLVVECEKKTSFLLESRNEARRRRRSLFWSNGASCVSFRIFRVSSEMARNVISINNAEAFLGKKKSLFLDALKVFPARQQFPQRF